MDEFDDIEKLYHDKLNEFSGKPDDRGWSRLENNLSIDQNGVEDWYKEKVETFDQVPNEFVWEKIAIKFDTETVWVRLVKSLQKRDRIIWWWNFSLKSSILLLALFIVFISDQTETHINKFANNELREVNNNSQVKLTTDKSNNTAKKDLEQDVEMQSKSNNFISTEEIAVDITSKNNNQYKAVNTIDLNKHSIVKEDSNTNANIINENLNTIFNKNQSLHTAELVKYSPLPPVMINTEVSPVLTFLNLPAVVVEHPKNDSSKRNNYFYVEASLVSPWLMNSDTYHSFRKNSNDYNQLMLTGGFGIGYVHWFEKFGIESNISFNKKGHNYMVYVEGRSYQKKINIDYINASLQIRKCITKDETKLSKSFLSGGVYYGRVLHQDIVFNGLPYGNATNYSKNDFGLSLSYEKVLVKKKKNISLGLSVSQGLINIYRGNSYIDFNRTYNTTISGSVKYLIPFKK